MATISNFFEQAQLSLAAYALDLQAGMSSSSIDSKSYIASLIAAGMSATQAADFANTYTVVEQSSGVGSLTGFSATLFQDAQGNKYLAIKGTNPFSLTGGPDLWADATIAFGNPVLDLQIPAMISFFTQLQTDGLITPTDTITVSGHSLGGYLAQLLTVYDPLQISQTYTYNAPGFSGASALVVNLLQQYMGTALNINIPAQITNVQGMGPNIIAGLGNVIGADQPIFTEGTTHSIVALTDSLAVYNLFAKLDPTLNTDPNGIQTMTNILTAESNVPGNSLESAMAALGKLFNVPSASVTGSAFDLYSAIDGFNNIINARFGVAPTIQSLVGMDAATMAANAQTDIAYRYALQQLNPFVAEGMDYSGFDQNGQLEVNNATTQSGDLNSQYFTDRAAMLAVLIQRNTQDVNFAPYPDDVYYSDAASGINLIPANEGHLGSNAFQHIAFGTDGATLNGGSLDDHLYAGSGNETLNGGAGNDSYYIEANQNSTDTIIDSDGIGNIYLGSTQLTGQTTAYQGNNLWVDASSGTQYQYDQLKQTLTITTGNDTITIDNFNQASLFKAVEDATNGYLGIHLSPPLVIAAGISLTAPAPTNQTVDVQNGNVQTVTIYGIGTVQLACAGSGTYACITGANSLSFANGPVNLTIPTGQDSVTVTLVDTSNSSSADTANLTATTTDASGNSVTSNNLAVTFDNPNPNAGSGGTPANTINGDLAPILDAHGNLQYDSLGNVITDPSKPAANRDDNLYGSASADLINTGGGTNYIIATQGGNDTLNGGNGNDNINAGNGANVISGNGGQDVLIAGQGSNQIFANAPVDLATALANQNTAASGQKGDLIAVGNGDNTIVGSNGNDAIFTGIGNNTIVMGNGANILLGGYEVTNALLSWSSNLSGGSLTFNNVTGTAAPFTAPANYNGVVFGGTPVGVGNDTIFGGTGDSTYLLSNGNNWLDAGRGNDFFLFVRDRSEEANDAKWRMSA